MYRYPTRDPASNEIPTVVQAPIPTLLHELRRSRHGVSVDVNSGKQICVSPLASLRSRATQLNLNTAIHQVSDRLPIGIAGRHVPVGIVRAVIQSHVARISVKDRNNL